VRNDFVHPEDIRIPVVHVEQVYRMRRLVTIEHAFLDDRHLEAISPTIDARRPYAVARTFADENDAVDIERVQMRHQRRPAKRAWRGFAYDCLTRQRRNLLNDVEAVTNSFGHRGIRRLCVFRVPGAFGPRCDAGIVRV